MIAEARSITWRYKSDWTFEVYATIDFRNLSFIICFGPLPLTLQRAMKIKEEKNMRFIIHSIGFIVFVFLSYSFTFGQISSSTTESSLVLEQGVAPHKGLDDVYRRFTEGYKKLDAASVVDLYTETAAYLVPGSNIKVGRQKVSEIFTGFFDSIKQQNGRLEISFRIVQRQVDRNLAYDVGIYTLTSYNQKGESSKGSGKFVVVARRDKGDSWRFQVDGYSALTNER